MVDSPLQEKEAAYEQKKIDMKNADVLYSILTSYNHKRV